jgi:carboxyl-terminal processing protease
MRKLLPHTALARAGTLLLAAIVAIALHGELAARERAAALVDEVRELVQKNFYDPEGLAAFDAAMQRGRKAVQSGAEPDGVVARSLQALEASHTGRYTPDQIEYYELMDIFRPGGKRRQTLFPPEGNVTYAGVGIAPRMLEGRHFIAHVYHGSPAERAGLRAGDEILAVDGKPYEPIGSFEGKAGRDVSVQVRRKEDEAAFTLMTPVVTIDPNEMFRNAIRSSAHVFDKDGRRLGYVRLWSYAARGVEQVLTALLSSDPLKDADGLVLDLRSRWGGAPADAAEMFIGRSRDMTFIDREGRETAVNARWRKPVVAIIDQGTRSGMEILAYSLKHAGVPLIGTRTAGAVLAGRGFLLDDNSLLVLAVADVKVDGQRLEGAGVSPDIEIAYDIRHAGGADPQFDRAATELLRRLGR